MARNNKPKVNTRCVADRYAGPSEKIIEVTGQDGIGCLISIWNRDDGAVSVHVHRRDRGLIASVEDRVE